MDEKQLEYIANHIEQVIDKKVNGKIDNLREDMMAKFSDHEEKMLPIYEAYTTANTFGKFVVWVSKITMALGIIIGGIIGLFKYFE